MLCPRAERPCPVRATGAGCALLIIAALLSAPHTAAAHAVLLGQFPRPGASLAAAPAEVRLRFDEAVTPVVIRVLDARGRVVSLPDAVSEVNTTVHLRLPDRLPPGTYVATYRVISADSHPVGGKADGSAMTPQAVSVWISSHALGIEAERYRAVRLLPGRYLITAPLPIAGTWTIEIDARVTDFTEAVFTTEVPVR